MLGGCKDCKRWESGEEDECSEEKGHYPFNNADRCTSFRIDIDKAEKRREINNE